MYDVWDCGFHHQTLCANNHVPQMWLLSLEANYDAIPRLEFPEVMRWWR